MFTVGKLKQVLQNLPDDMPIGLSVYNHAYYSNYHYTSHGELHWGVGRFCDEQDILMLYVMDWPRDGYLVKKITEEVDRDLG